MPVVILATLDTKGHEAAYVRDRLRSRGVSTLLVDAGSLGPATVTPDIGRDEVFARAGTSAEAVKAQGDRGEAVAAAARVRRPLVGELAARGRVDGLIGLGGSAGTVIGTSAMPSPPLRRPQGDGEHAGERPGHARTSAAATSSCCTPWPT
ncbi:MAG: Tm-1-like ATP-binding domain-containing protein [Isosphaeraceae bacterium]